MFLRNNPRGGEEDPGRLAGGWVYGLPLLLALTIFFGINLFAAQKQLVAEQKKLNTNLNYFQYLYRNSPLHPIAITAKDQVVGDPEVAIHQIVLVYKDGCRHCLAAKEKLAEEVQNYPEGVYLVLKNFRNFSSVELDRLGISRAPTVFINGKIAEGWDVPGFLDEFTDGCGC
jgi:glutaredoxin